MKILVGIITSLQMASRLQLKKLASSMAPVSLNCITVTFMLNITIEATAWLSRAQILSGE